MKRLLSVALMVLVTLIGMVGVSSAADKEIQSIMTELQNIQQTLSSLSNAVSALQASANATHGAVSTHFPTVNDRVVARAKKYYLTVPGFTGSSSIRACDSGFHMASISEFQDPSNLQYAIRPTPVYDSHDSPVYDQGLDQDPAHTGWVRTGVDQLAAFVDDCDIWRSSSNQRLGTMMTRSHLRGVPGSDLVFESEPAAWWQSTQMASCSQPASVWCVEDPD